METLKTVEMMGKMDKGAWLLIVPLLALILIGSLEAKKMMMDENEKNVVGLLIFVLGAILSLIVLVLHTSYNPGSLTCWIGGVMSLACAVVIAGLHFKWSGFTPPAATFLQILLSMPFIASMLMLVGGIILLFKDSPLGSS